MPRLIHPRSFWILLLLGVALRSIALFQPLIDAHTLRQCQTAAATRSLIDQPGFPLTSAIPWLGNPDLRYIQEIPIYNYLAIGLHSITGNLDLSGKLTSILLWVISFFLLQSIWRRFLDPQPTFWANLLFISAPLSVFYGQAFMPEMLVQSLAFAFILAILRYSESSTLSRWSIVASLGLVALLVKLPEVSHLYLILGVLLFRREGLAALRRPRYLLAALLTVVALKGWSGYVDSINQISIPEWTSQPNLKSFLGPLSARLHPKPWINVAFYLGAFVVTGPAALAAIAGLWTFLRRPQPRGFLGLWLLSIVAFYLIWFGNAGPSQSYYNLPTLAPLCALFGIGITTLLSSKSLAPYPRTATISVCALLTLSIAPVLFYLFKPDRQILQAALWTRHHTRPGDLILFRANHRWDMVDYFANPVFAYYAQRLTVVRTPLTPHPVLQLGLDHAQFAILTLPPPPVDGWLGKLHRFRGAAIVRPEPTDWLENARFHPAATEEGFAVYQR